MIKARMILSFPIFKTRQLLTANKNLFTSDVKAMFLLKVRKLRSVDLALFKTLSKYQSKHITE